MSDFKQSFTEDELTLERHDQEFREKYEKTEIVLDLDECPDLDFMLVIELVDRMKAAKIYKLTSSGYEMFDSNNTYLFSVSVKHDNPNILKTIEILNLKKEI